MIGLVVSASVMIGCPPNAPSTDSLSPDDPYYAALTSASRSDADRERDALRRPHEILALAEVREGMRILDLIVGGGWYTEVLSRAVGSGGQVIAHNSPLTNERYGSQLLERLEGSRLPNVETVVQEVDALEFPPSSLDAVFLVQFYHDTYWMEVDRDAMNRAVFDALKPGGVYLVIDHSAEPGSGARDTESLHRVDEAMVREEVIAAGFRVEAESKVLRNAEDPRDGNVFKAPIRGRTDRFVFKFVKPGGGSVAERERDGP
jgi:predicted methyltransferase